MKCHDLKHKLEAIRAGGVITEEEMREMENAVAVYDGSLKTGNDDLDIVIAEKNLHCIKENISLACIIDGKQLDFMSSGDIYSLFGNALDNAIEYLEKVEDVDKRLINLSVQQKSAFIGIRVENYCESVLKFENGLPVSTKSDKDFHGFGMKSMRHIVDKYGGSMFCEQKGGMFELNIIFSKKQGAV